MSWLINPTDNLNEFFDHIDRLLRLASGAELVVFPELFSLELLGGQQNLAQSDIAPYLCELLAPALNTFGELAKSHDTTAIFGSHFCAANNGFQNCALIGFPNGTWKWGAPKVNLTQFEKNDWKLNPGGGLTKIGEQIGVTICYDSEFPESSLALADSGVVIQVVPAFTETKRGFQRVRWSCQARAIENQIYVVHSSLVGSLGHEPVPSAVGSSAILTPSIEPFPESCVLAETEFNLEGVAISECPYDLIVEARNRGDVQNWNDRINGQWDIIEDFSFE